MAEMPVANRAPGASSGRAQARIQAEGSVGGSIISILPLSGNGEGKEWSAILDARA
jgi:hypothetical protein